METEPNFSSNQVSARITPKQMPKKQPSLDLLKDNRSLTIEQIKKVLQREKTDAKTTLKNKIQQPKQGATRND
jgi:hypothetical protein